MVRQSVISVCGVTLLWLAAGCPSSGAESDATTADLAQPDTVVIDAAAGDSARSDAARPDADRDDHPPADTGARDANDVDATALDGGAPDGGAPDGGVRWDAGYPPEEVVGQITVMERWFGSSRYTQLSANFFDRPSVVLALERWFSVVAEEGGCQVYESSQVGDDVFCDPACSQGEFCTPAETCEPFPQFRSAGDIAITGLSQPVTLEAQATHYQGPYIGTEVFEPDADIVARAAGDATPAFTVAAVGVEDMRVLTAEPIEVVPGQPLAFDWVAGARGDWVEVYLTPIVHTFHYKFLRCRVPDNGHLTIPAPLVEQIADNFGCCCNCGNIAYVARFSEGHVASTHGFIRLRVESRVRLDVRLPE